MKDSTAKIISIATLIAISITSGEIMSVPVVVVASIAIILQKTKTPHERLRSEIKHMMKYSNEDAEEYAKYLEKMCLKEYQNAYEERTITRED